MCSHWFFPQNLATSRGPDEIQRMKEVGNSRAAMIYGGSSHRPGLHAATHIWLDYLRDKYELKKFASVTHAEKRDDSKTAVTSTDDDDLLDIHHFPPPQKANENFFASFGL